MIYKKLGGTDISIPAIAQGTSGMGSYDHSDPHVVEERIAALIYGINHGLNFIDTAEMYGGGFVEEKIGEIIVGMRDKIFLASKFNQRKDVGAELNRSIEGSLVRLKTDYLDLYQVHWPNPAIPVSGIMEALYKLVKRSLVRYVGVSNFSKKDFIAAQSYFKEALVSNQLEYNLLDRSAEDGFLPYASEHRITFIAYSPLNQGGVFGSEAQRKVLEALAEKYKKTAPQIVLRWLVSHSSVITVAKMKDVGRVKENIAAMEFDLSSEDIALIDRAAPMETRLVPAKEIRLMAPGHRKPYMTLEEAIEDKQKLFPSPMTIATMVKNGDYVKPIRLTPTSDAKSDYTYDVDQYDSMDQVKKYWGWIIAYGKDVEIPAFILPRK